MSLKCSPRTGVGQDRGESFSVFSHGAAADRGTKGVLSRGKTFSLHVPLPVEF